MRKALPHSNFFFILFLQYNRQCGDEFPYAGGPENQEFDFLWPKFYTFFDILYSFSYSFDVVLPNVLSVSPSVSNTVNLLIISSTFLTKLSILVCV